MKSSTLVAVMCVLLVLICGCSVKSPFVTKPIDSPLTIDVASINPRISDAKLKQVIMEACMRRGWKIDQITGSTIQASLDHQGKEKATVDIFYSKQKIEIKYKDSVNLRYDGAKIHRSYNRWVKNLQTDISSGIAGA